MHDSGLGRILGALAAPKKTFESIAERPTWVAPLVLLVLLGTGLAYVVHLRTDYDDVTHRAFAQRGVQVDDQALDRAIGLQKKYGGVFAIAGGLVFSPIVYLLGTLFFWGALLLLGGKLRFATAFSVFLYGCIPLGVSAALSSLVVWRATTLEYTQLMTRQFLASSLAAFAPEGMSLPLRSLLASVDLFSIWTIVLLVIGYKVAAKVSTATATTAVLVVWVIGVAVKVGLTVFQAGGLS